MDTPATQHKLAEAWFFLTEHLKAWERPELKKRPEVLKFYLSAFLSAARSVTFALQNEAKDQYDSWFRSWLEGLPEEDKKVLRFMNEQRVSEVHQEGAVTIRKQTAVPVKSHPGTQTWVWTYVDELYFEFEGAPLKVIDFCERYLLLLQRLVNDFLEKFNHQRRD